jgi:hypothetical protein
MTTVSRIMEHVHRGTIGTVYSVLDGEFEFIEAKILEKSELVNKSIKRLEFARTYKNWRNVLRDRSSNNS